LGIVRLRSAEPSAPPEALLALCGAEVKAMLRRAEPPPL